MKKGTATLSIIVALMLAGCTAKFSIHPTNNEKQVEAVASTSTRETQAALSEMTKLLGEMNQREKDKEKRKAEVMKQIMELMNKRQEKESSVNWCPSVS